jgi:hypothetical protein
MVRKLEKVLTDGVHNLQEGRLRFVISFSFSVVVVFVVCSFLLSFSFDEKNIIANV